MTNKKAPKCPICGAEMIMTYGWGSERCGYYDCWVCSFFMCPGVIELDETTYPEGFEE